MAKKAPETETETGGEPQPETAGITHTATAHLCEGGVQYKPGDGITLTPARAAALGSLVKAAG